MAELKTRQTEASVKDSVAALPDAAVRADCQALIDLLQAATGAPPRLWGPSIIGFGLAKLTYASGRELEWMRCGFSPRKGKISLYLSLDIRKQEPYLAKLGKHSTGKSCLYIKRMADVDQGILKQLVEACLRGSCG